MEKMKYIMLEYGPVIFSCAYTHVDMARGKKVLSAGFVGVDDKGKFYCYGQSTSLGINSDPRDSDRINDEFNREW